MDKINDMVSENSVVIFSKSSCCMCHSIKSLFYDIGVNPTVYEIDEIEHGQEIEAAILQLGGNTTVPAVFLGGEFEGGAKEILNLHVNGALEPKLIHVGALDF
ncbi:hypothetical protein ACS0TY_022605 [Phlomoides rotata]